MRNKKLSMGMLDLQLKAGLEPTKTWQRRLPRQTSATAATAQTFYIDIPRDHFIHEIIIQMTEGTTLVDRIVDLKIVGNGSKYLKDVIGVAVKEIMKMNGHRPATGFYHLYFTDPLVKEAKPLPAWVFTSLQLIITDSAPGTGAKHNLDVTLIESAYRGEPLGDWRVLVEKYLLHKRYGGSTGYMEYEHERAYKVFSYLYIMDDNLLLSDTIYDKIKLLGRKPDEEITLIDEVPILTQKQANNSRIPVSLATGFIFLQWQDGFPTAEFSSLKTYINIPTAGTNAGLRVIERYVL